VLALIPGRRARAITITTGLLAGLDRGDGGAVRVSAGHPDHRGPRALKEALRLIRSGEHVGDTGPILVAILVSFLSGWFAVWFLVNYSSDARSSRS